jgi:hypothetical protein
MSRYPSIYGMLKRSGHSPLKAAQIILDATRGDELAVAWIKGLRKLQKKAKEKEVAADIVAATAQQRQREADRIDGYDRDDLGESPDF